MVLLNGLVGKEQSHAVLAQEHKVDENRTRKNRIFMVFRLPQRSEEAS